MINIFIILIPIIGIPVAFIFLLKWIYQIKKNSDYQVEQNNRIIQLLKRLDDES